jgi:hypothetical protein
MFHIAGDPMNQLLYGDNLPILRQQAEKEAVGAGYEETDLGRFRKIQILTVEELMTGARANLPVIDNTAFRKARREDDNQQSEMDV